jgi:DNA-binding CsgD family transcriptional regulator/DNA-directed RNA polymerase subunit RPC12/RpoP
MYMQALKPSQKIQKDLAFALEHQALIGTEPIKRLCNDLSKTVELEATSRLIDLALQSEGEEREKLICQIQNRLNLKRSYKSRDNTTRTDTIYKRYLAQNLRKKGATFQEIGDLLGMSRQRVQTLTKTPLNGDIIPDQEKADQVIQSFAPKEKRLKQKCVELRKKGLSKKEIGLELEINPQTVTQKLEGDPFKESLIGKRIGAWLILNNVEGSVHKGKWVVKCLGCQRTFERSLHNIIYGNSVQCRNCSLSMPVSERATVKTKLLEQYPAPGNNN